MTKRVAKPKYSQFEKSLRGTLAYNIRLLRFENGISQEELKKVEGVGEKTFEKLKDRVIVN